MNIERLKVLTNIYMDRYADITEGPQDVRNRWAAVSSCLKHWDLEADSFGTMFDEATKAGVSLIQGTGSDPRGGILFLCENGKEEEVREAFAGLLERGRADGAEKQEKAMRFVKKINAMLAEMVPDKWEYRQRIRTAIRYLALIRPNDNYYFRASDVAAFSGYTEVEELIGYDKSLELGNYYRMCDDVTSYLAERDDLLRMVNISLEHKGRQIGDPDLARVDMQYHLLAADLICAAYRFDFYAEKAANRKSKISVVAQRKIGRAKKRAELLDERESIVDELDALEAVEAKAQIPDLWGLPTRHSAFGEGKITDQSGKYITVKFSNATKRFALPGAVIGGFLKFDDASIMDTCKRMDSAVASRKDAENRLTSVDVQLQLLE